MQLMQESKALTLSNMQEKKVILSTNDASVIFLELNDNIKLTTKKCRDANHTVLQLKVGDKHIAKALLYNELFICKRNVGQQKLCYKDVCMHDLKILNVKLDEWQKLFDNSSN